jgi:hypothetical protein
MPRRLTSALLLTLAGAVLAGCSSSTSSSNTTKVTETPAKIEQGKHRGQGPTESTKVP